MSGLTLAFPWPTTIMVCAGLWLSTDSMVWARDEACRELTKKLLSRIEGKKPRPTSGPVTYKPKKSSRVVGVEWNGEMKPMPLIKLTEFFKEMGYNAKMIESGSNRVKFRVTFKEPIELFRSKVRTLLDAHYRIVSISGESELNFQIEAP